MDARTPLQTGDVIDGFLIKERLHHEPDDDKMQRKLSRGGLGLSAKELVVKSLASPAQVEKVLKARDNWKELKPTFEKFYQSKVTGVKLVHKTAKGIEVRPETAVEFLKAMEENPDE